MTKKYIQLGLPLTWHIHVLEVNFSHGCDFFVFLELTLCLLLPFMVSSVVHIE